MTKKKKLITTVASLVALSTMSGAPSQSMALSDSAKSISSVQVTKPTLSNKLLLTLPQNQEELVRVIVELNEAPAIEEATKKGKRYKDLTENEKENLEQKIVGKQNNVKEKIKGKVKQANFKENFTTAFNGFSLEIAAKDLNSLASLEDVKAVYESIEYIKPAETPEMVSSKELVQAQLAWDKYQFKGEGMVIGVIDSGIDPSHRDFVLSQSTKEELTQKEVNKKVKQGKIEPGKYFSDKIPFGYNYMDDNQEVRDLGPGASMHGQHVSGTVGANGDESKGGIKGVAPESQILALKVFGNDPEFPSTYGDIYVKAIDDAIKLGADVINMSLGATAGYQDENSPEQQAVSRAQKNGLIVSISAGNSDMFGSGYYYPSTTNQDYGLTGSPSVSKDSFGVASYENTMIAASGFSYSAEGEALGEALYLLANDVKPQSNVAIDVVDAGFGTPNDFINKDLTGKYALISRGSITFVEKALNAQAAGAAGVIVYNNAEGTINMASDPSIKVPFMSTLKVDGLAIKAQLDAGKQVSVNFDGRTVYTANPEKGKMSSFTSWGPTPNLDFKPEITAPGGNIYSTLNSDSYGLMSGTSMAAPHVAGGSALVLERVDREFKLKGSDRAKLAKNLMMNTAKPIELTPGEYVSPRRQGAGIMQLANALETDVLVTNAATGDSKVALKEISESKFELTLNVENFGDTEKTYNVALQLQSDSPVNAGGGNFVTLPNDSRFGSYVFVAGPEGDFTAQFPDTITLGGNETKELKIVVDASGSEWLKDYFTNGYFIDGFVSLTDATSGEEDEVLPSLVVPFFGFNGSWDDAPIFDENFWNEDKTFWGYQGLYTFTETGAIPVVGKTLEDGSTDPSTFAFSPNNDGKLDSVLPVFSLMRNAKELQVNVLDSSGKVVRTIRNEVDLRKNYISTNAYNFNPNTAWDGKINGQLAQDGQYSLQLKARIDYTNSEWQTVDYNLYLDTTAPELYLDLDGDATNVGVEIMETGSGVDRVEVVSNGNVVKTYYDEVSSLDLSAYPKEGLQVVVWDVAGNSNQVGGTSSEDATNPTSDQVGNVGDSTKDEKWQSSYDAPVVSITSPGFFAALDQSTITVTGQVTDNTSVTKVLVNGQEAKLEGSTYSSSLQFKDDVHIIRVEAMDDEGNITSVQRRIFVDTSAPVITSKTKQYTAALDAKTFELPLTIKDNFDEVRLYVNDSEVFYNPLSEPYAMSGFTHTLSVSIPLTDSITKAEIKAVDLAGNTTIYPVTIEKTNRKGNSKK